MKNSASACGVPNKPQHLFQTIFVVIRNLVAVSPAACYCFNGENIAIKDAGQVVLKHNGTIWAESDGVGKGSTFVVKLLIASAK